MKVLIMHHGGGSIDSIAGANAKFNRKGAGNRKAGN